MDKIPDNFRKKYITIGADPEFFLYDRHRPISAIGLIGGTKQNPAPLGRPGFAIQEDNVAVEFNIPPAKTLNEFLESIEWSLETIRQTINANGLSIKIEPTARFHPSDLEHPQAKELGCDPDYNAWTGQVNPRPVLEGHFKELRSAGGHVHVGWEDANKDHPLFKRKVIQAMDLFLGVPSVIMDTNWSRRGMYGKAGAHRRPEYGVEYRTLSNFWLRKPEYVSWVYTQAIRAFNHACQVDPWWKSLDDLRVKIVDTINLNDENTAKQMVKDFLLSVV